MKKILGFFLLSASSLYAGTPGSSDVSILYGIAMAIFAMMLGVDYLIQFIKKRKLEMEAKENELLSNEGDEIL